MDFYVSINPQTAITKDNIQLNCIDSLGNIVSTDEYLLPTYETMYQSGAEELTATIEEISSTVEPMKNVDNWSNCVSGSHPKEKEIFGSIKIILKI